MPAPRKPGPAAYSQGSNRQNYRAPAGQYARVNPCDCCGKSAGTDPYGDRRTDTTDSCGNVWDDRAIMLCKRCYTRLDKMGDADAWAYLDAQQAARTANT